jgi:simple sugar transport system ATP-binding protein
MNNLAVEMAGITKRLTRCVANNNVSLSAKRGEVHAIVGENGAGKSTLMKILYGLLTPDEGTIFVRGKQLTAHSPKEAIAAGVGMVFQHFMLVESLTVAENIVLGREPVRGLSFDRARAMKEVGELAEKFGLEIDPAIRVSDCSVGLQQRVEILKVLFRGAEVIVLDEPTAVLTPQEIEELIRVMRRLAGEGKTILLITHKLREVMAAADRVTIMRRGETVTTLEIEKTSVEEIAEKMVGRKIEPPPREETHPGKIILSVEKLSASSDRGIEGLKEASFEVRAGEILGIAGIEGNGQTELLEVLSGLRRASAGRVVLDGVDLTEADPRAHYDAGLAHVPEDRHERAIILDFSIAENSILGSQREFSTPLALNLKKAKRHAETIIEKNDVRPPEPLAPLRELSGGNQQKVVIGREILRNPKLLLAAHPTRGLDIGAIEQVQEKLREARAAGAAIVLVSSELSELLALSDRMIVMFAGRVLEEVDPRAIDEKRLGLMMAGGARTGARA